MINVNLVGNPNTGKTTLYNSLTSSNEHVGNWHGVTVEEKAKSYKYKGKEVKLVDLPGIYSLSALSFEEEVATRYILNNKNSCVINICDANNLERNLYLTLGLMELGCFVILAINQIDRNPLYKINFTKLEEMLGLKVVPVNASDKKSVQRINDEIVKFSNDKTGNISYNLPYLKGIDFSSVEDKKISLFQKIKCLEDDEIIKNEIGEQKVFNGLEQVAQARYEYIDEIIKVCCSEKTKVYGHSSADKFVLNRFLAIPIFLLFMAIAFYFTFFSVGRWLSDGLNFLLNHFIGNPIIELFAGKFGEGAWITGLVEVAIVGGLGSLLSFLPQVALLFFFLSLLEDSGYLARVAFVVDDILSKVGLSGKSVYTLLMGFGCSTTSILTARNMEDKNSKIKTSLLAPYMSCSAKFPIYAVIGGAFFGAKNIFVIMGLYLLGIIVAVLISFILEKTALKSKEQSFILEFPPYRMMSAKRVLKVLWLNVKMFVLRVGSLILSMNIIVWILSNFSFTFKYVGVNGGSMLEKLGEIFAPVFYPLGFNNWALVGALIAGLIAKEVIVSSIAMFNGCELSMNEVQKSLFVSSSVVFFINPSAVLSYLIFCLLYSPCLASISVLAKEIGRKWTFIGVAIQFAIAYLISFVVYNFSRFAYFVGGDKFILIIGVALVILGAILFVCKRVKTKKMCPYCDSCKKDCKKK